MTHASLPTTLEQLVARSRKLGADRSIANWGGGNTSAKAEEIDFRGRRVRVLWVKGSGSDLATVTEASFTGLSRGAGWSAYRCYRYRPGGRGTPGYVPQPPLWSKQGRGRENGCHQRGQRPGGL